MIPQIKSRKIGAVKVIDIQGELSGPWALRSKETIKRMLSQAVNQRVVFNLQQMTNVDSLGVKTLLESVPEGQELEILFGSNSVTNFIKHFSQSKPVRAFQSEAEIALAFGEAFMDKPTSGAGEQREFVRMQTVIPIEFHYEDNDEKMEFRAIATNLSEGGLYAEYIDLKMADQSLECLNPYDLKILDLKLFFPKGKVIRAMGKMAHCRLEGEQIGIGIQFMEIGSRELDEIRNFMGSYETAKNCNRQLRKEG
ncbi:MAG: PilZ domain-containing protein [Candidatus Omnitrophica bacterium]|nr:PilZ domain-containing protein [Candidatus Omnitrophota bacterium]